MALTTHIRGEFGRKTIQLGDELYRRNKVTQLTKIDNAVTAEVEEYDVVIGRERDHLVASCTCDYFWDIQKPCREIWAVLLAAEAKGLLQAKDGSDPTFLGLSWDDEDDEEEPFFDGFDDDDEDDIFFNFDPNEGNPWAKAAQELIRSAPVKQQPDWKQQFQRMKSQLLQNSREYFRTIPIGSQIIYIIQNQGKYGDTGMHLDVAYHERLKSGDWGKPKSLSRDPVDLDALTDPIDKRVLTLLTKAENTRTGYGSRYESRYSSATEYYRPTDEFLLMLLPELCPTGRCFFKFHQNTEIDKPLQWYDDPIRFSVVIRKTNDHFTITPQLLIEDTPLKPDPKNGLLLTNTFVISGETAAPVYHPNTLKWMNLLDLFIDTPIPVKDAATLRDMLYSLPELPPLEAPEELQVSEVVATPKPRLMIKPAKKVGNAKPRLQGFLSFDYDGSVVDAYPETNVKFIPEDNRLIRRDSDAEQQAKLRLHEIGVRQRSAYDKFWDIASTQLGKIVMPLLREGWHVEAEGKLYRTSGPIQIEVRSGIDWFELHGNVSFDDTQISLPELLKAVKKGDNVVQLDDGTIGMLPDDWLKKYGLLTGLGKKEKDHLRFEKSQVGLLDALLASQPDANWDEAFSAAREKLRSFEGIQPADPTADFKGKLRDYQRDGLGWLHFLTGFGFGGCLADDMGLGKTVQVLAMLDDQRRRAQADGEKQPPALVVVPRSLIFNWMQEAERFTPKLRVLDYSGVDREKDTKHFADYDIILTTYGTMRRDVTLLKDYRFSYCILDEAQAIKNSSSLGAKAARLMQADHRLALSGTPIENHLGELWSLFEFLNPGMLGSASVFKMTGLGARNPEEETRRLLSSAMRPFILRRTKDQVAKDLPDKIEQTLYCELEPKQRKLYDELRDHYRKSLLKKVGDDGINKSKIQILEALLRLRQAACHPGLVDKNRTTEASAKLDMLLPQVLEVIDEGHKTLVFSQFTSFLKILRDKLDKEKITYEYLDGQTTDRQSKVERFQNDPECKLFLISLKAGGLGLNLTAAEYVFLLDPWWNPAVEAQAIDRAHRIGQSQRVFAYRLIARNTVEEKVLELQKNKRQLADAIINADNSLIRNLGREDLELLLS